MKNPLYIFLFLILISCKDDDKKIITQNYNAFNATESDTITKSIFGELPEKYIQQKGYLVENFFNEHLNNLQDFNGGFLVAKNGQVIFEKYQGKSNFTSNDNITESTALHLASISKVLTATAIFKLVDAKKLTLDEKVKTILPSFPYPKITIRMLLNHRSGLAQYSKFTEPNAIWGKSKTLRNSDILNLLGTKNIALEFTPNTKFAYCNTNYAILALIIENLTSQTYPEAMQSLIFKPLKMNNTFVFELDKDKNNVSQSYKSTKEKVPFDQLDAIYGDKNIYSTPQDLLKFDLATYKPNFISEELKKEIYKGYSYEKKGIKNYGLGIRLREWETGQEVFYHNGWWHGNTSSYITLKNDTVTMIALSNKFSRKVYQTMRISAIFGDYPFKLNDKESE